MEVGDMPIQGIGKNIAWDITQLQENKLIEKMNKERLCR
jgi:hypothetical protein